MLILLVVAAVVSSALVLLCGIGMSRAAAESDRASESSARGMLLRVLARRIGDRRGWNDRRLLREHVENDRRVSIGAGDRRRNDRRVDPMVVDPRP